MTARSSRLFARMVCGALLAAAARAAHAGPPADGEQFLLWPVEAPEADGAEATDKPAITAYIPPAGKSTGAAVIVNPGGAYRILAADHEGAQVARMLNKIGVAAFVLRYRVMPKYRPRVALVDAQRAIRFVRFNAAEWGISPDRIGMLGFSAGGHLASAAGTMFDDGDAEAPDPVDRVGCRPDFIAPIYPAISGELFNRADDYRPTHVLATAKSPPAFIVHSHEDTGVVPTHSILFYQALMKNRVPAELHIFGFGEHGMGLGSGDADFGGWPELFANWLRRSKLLTAAPRIAVEGTVTIDGEPIAMGWVSFTPEDPNAPPARAFMISRHAEGKFSIKEEHGPIAGRHRVEVIRNSKISPLTSEGNVSLEEAERFTKASPGDAKPMIAELKEGAPIEIRIKTGKTQ